MRAYPRVLVLAAALAVLLAAGCGEEQPKPGKGSARKGDGKKPPVKTVKTVKAGEHQLSGPYTHRNLTIFLVHGKDRIKGKKFITLQEALAKKKAVLHETGNVQKLAIENLSKDELIYLQSGDIVKGGKQDRVIAYDFIVPPKSGKVSISSFCVESGRWRGRGKESLAVFKSSEHQITSQSLKLATKLDADQKKVWAEVGTQQRRLGISVGGEVRSDKSRTSMQLTLEHKKVRAAIKGYKDALAKITKGKKDVIGFAFAINGKVNSADIYASGDLFQKLWPKLLEAAATEAVTEFKKDAKFKEPGPKAVKTCLEEAKKGKASDKKLSERVRMTTRKGKGVYGFWTIDEKYKVIIHDSVIVE